MKLKPEKESKKTKKEMNDEIINEINEEVKKYPYRDRIYVDHRIKPKGGFFRGLYRLFRGLFIILERSLKIIAIFVISISAAILFLATSFYLIYNTFGLKESPSFQNLREEIITEQTYDEIKEEIVENLDLKKKPIPLELNNNTN